MKRRPETDEGLSTPEKRPGFPMKLVSIGDPTTGKGHFGVDIFRYRECADEEGQEIEYRTETVARAILLVLPVEISDRFIGRFEVITGADAAMLLSPSEIGGPWFPSRRYEITSRGIGT